MGVSVVLVAYHGDRWLPACLDSLADASAGRLHLVLVDNSGNHGIDELPLSRFDTEVLRTDRPLGFADANNFALCTATRLEPYVLFLNQDTISRPGWIDRCIACFAEAERLGAASPLIRTYDDGGWDPSFLACLEPDEAQRELGPGSEVEEGWFRVQRAPAPALIVRRDVLRESGPFDPVFGSYYEDYDLCRRVRALGFEIGFCRGARIAHFSGSTTDTRARELRRMRQIIRNRLLYQLRQSDRPRTSALLRHVLVQLPRNLGRGLIRTPSSQPPSVTLQAHWDLLLIFHRLVSRQQDERAWQQYLRKLGWPCRIPASHASSNQTAGQAS